MNRQTVKNKIKIVDIAEEDFNLKKEGNYLVGLCPKCKRAWGTLKINTTNDYAKCYSCGFHAKDSIDYFSKNNNLEESEAISKMVKIYNIKDDSLLAKKLKTNKKKIVEVKEPPLNPEILDAIYTEFSTSSNLIGEPKLSEEDYKYLRNRGLTDEDIEENEYFSMPSRAVMPYFYEKLKTLNLDIYLSKTPGFFFRNSFDDWSFYYISSIVIPIKNEYGQIVCLQLRRRVVLSDKIPRYLWFSSPWLNDSIPNFNGYTKGTSSGTPISVSLSKNLKSTRLVITEGGFKAHAVSKEGHNAISIQGVYSYKAEDIISCVKNICKIQNININEISIFYDADMKYNTQVLEAVFVVADVLRDYFEVTIGTWDVDKGKGIDDFLENNNFSEVKIVKYSTFRKVADQFISYLKAYNITDKDIMQKTFDEMAEKYNF